MKQWIKIFFMGGFVWCNIGLAMVNAEEQRTAIDLLEQAKKISVMEKLFNGKRNINIIALKLFLEDKDPKIRAITVDMLGQSNNTEIVELVKKKEADSVWFVRRASKMVRTARELEKTTAEERWQHLINISQASPWKIESFARLYIKKGWARNLDEIESKVPKSKPYLSNEQNRIKITKSLSVLSQIEKKKQAIRVLKGQMAPIEQEQAILALMELGKETVPDILELLTDKKNIPTSSGPPWDKTHTIYSGILLALKCIPDKRAIPLLEELARKKELFINKEAQETLLWVKAGVQYPLRYKRILMATEDDVPPGE